MVVMHGGAGAQVSKSWHIPGDLDEWKMWSMACGICGGPSSLAVESLKR